MFFRFLNNEDNFSADVFPGKVRFARQGDHTGAEGAKSMDFATFYQICELVQQADPNGPLANAEF